MYSVPAHEVDFHPPVDFAVKATSRMEKYILKLEEGPYLVDAFMGVIYSDARKLLLMDPEVRNIDTWRSWVSVMQYYGAVMEADGVPHGETFGASVGGRRILVEGLGRPVNATPGKWLTSFFMAVSCREESRWKGLCGISIEKIMEAAQGGSAVYEKSVFPWIAAIQAFVNKEPGAFQYLDQAEDWSERWGEKYPEKFERISCLVRPKYDVLRRFIAGDSSGYNESLARALFLHKDYYSSSGELREDPAGAVSLPLLGLACWGFDRSLRDESFSFQVDSGYLPKFILEGRWVGELPI